MRRLVTLAALAFASMGAECLFEDKGEGSSTTADETDADADSDSDSDADTDVDADSDADSDVDTGWTGTNPDNLNPPPTVECGEPYDTPSTGNCVTSTISCGETLYGSNAGGSTIFEADGQFEQCSGSATGDDFAGPERVYKLNVPNGINSLEVNLDSCHRSWLLWYQSVNECPGVNEDVLCSYPAGNGSSFNRQYESILVAPARVVYFVVEGYQNEGGNFSLSVDCF